MTEITVVAAAIIHEKKLLVTQRGSGSFQGMWELPGGKVENNETFEEALKREILEEISLNIQIEKYLATIKYQYPSFYLTMHVYLCHIENGELILNEHSASRWVTSSQLKYINWLPADLDLLPKLEKALLNYSSTK